MYRYLPVIPLPLFQYFSVTGARPEFTNTKQHRFITRSHKHVPTTTTQYAARWRRRLGGPGTIRSSTKSPSSRQPVADGAAAASSTSPPSRGRHAANRCAHSRCPASRCRSPSCFATGYAWQPHTASPQPTTTGEWMWVGELANCILHSLAYAQSDRNGDCDL